MSDTDLKDERIEDADLRDEKLDASEFPEDPDGEPETESESLDEDNRLKADYVRAVKDALWEEDFDRVYELVEPLHPADIADLFELVDADERPVLARSIRDLMGVEVIAELNDWVRELLVETLPAEVVAGFAGELDTDDAVAMLEDLDEDNQRAVLAEMEPEDRAAIESALSYPDESAGRMMSREFVAVPETMTVGDLIDFLREHRELPTEFWEVFIVDPMHRPIGTCVLSWILRCPRNIPLYDVMKREQTLIPVDMDQEEVALRFQKYALISAAVVDTSGRLIGQITVDDVVHIISEEAGEDALLLSGAGDGDINEPIRDAWSGRVRWLIANLLTATLASAVIAMFEDTIAAMVALATLMPIVAGLGGNAGTQTLAVTVRALAMNQLTPSNAWRAVRREMTIALLNGGTVAVIIGIAVSLIFGNPMLGGVIAAAMMTNIVIAGMAGVLIPLTLERLKADPAISSSVFVTMTTDSMGFLVFLGLATMSGLVG
ncbi:magnesium transporter [Novosphingobium sp. BW1]|uniref:magnesium transporter n=1 Tax=Novosphingobium sp. BW1 TaxID=2592621 RepID=UPI0011DE5DC3|nr:magnesium transporter [Novosphingobium sp. BW1]TYC87494.1 magnesium transporter [Novosphingobium sp. BW1]